MSADKKKIKDVYKKKKLKEYFDFYEEYLLNEISLIDKDFLSNPNKELQNSKIILIEKLINLKSLNNLDVILVLLDKLDENLLTINEILYDGKDVSPLYVGGPSESNSVLGKLNFIEDSLRNSTGDYSYNERLGNVEDILRDIRTFLRTSN